MEKIIYAGKLNIGIKIDHRSHVDKICRILNDSGVKPEYTTGSECNSILCYRDEIGSDGSLTYDTYAIQSPACDTLVTSTYFLENVNKTILFDGITK